VPSPDEVTGLEALACAGQRARPAQSAPHGAASVERRDAAPVTGAIRTLTGTGVLVTGASSGIGAATAHTVTREAHTR
jgi:NADPH:quinone reductase-like Zn-dependent oxidoreductase